MEEAFGQAFWSQKERITHRIWVTFLLVKFGNVLEAKRVPWKSVLENKKMKQIMQEESHER